VLVQLESLLVKWHNSSRWLTDEQAQAGAKAVTIGQAGALTRLISIRSFGGCQTSAL